MIHTLKSKKLDYNICIIGGGNIGTLLLADLSQKASVRLLTSKPERWNKKVDVYDSKENYKYSGNIDIISSNPKDVIPDADIIISTLPSHVFKNAFDSIKPFINQNAWIGSMPGSGGSEFYIKDSLKNNQVIFGFQRVHGISRIREYGRSVYDLGKKTELYIGAIPSAIAPIISKEMEELIDIPCFSLPNYLTITLTPSNPILHTSRLYSLFKNYKETKWNSNVLFYGEWDNISSETLFGADSELQMLCQKIEGIDLSSVKSLKEHYESQTVAELTNKITSIEAFKNIEAPMIKENGYFYPDFNSRYFKEDFPFGLCILKSFCYLLNVKTPVFDRILHWYESISGQEFYKDGKFVGESLAELFIPQNFGINNLSDIYEFYN